MSSDPYNSPVFATRVALIIFRNWATWKYVLTFLSFCAAWIFFAHYFDPSLVALNLTLSIMAIVLECLLGMATKAINEHDRKMLAHAENLGEQEEGLLIQIKADLVDIRKLLKEKRADD